MRLPVAREQVRSQLLVRAARPMRFAAVGAACGVLQLVALVLLKAAGMEGIPANVAAYLLSAQVNFVLSSVFIWGDRQLGQRGMAGLARQWISFHGSIAGTFLLSQSIFLVGRLELPDVTAAALGIGAAALVNFVIQDRITFRSLLTPRPDPSRG